MEYDIFSRNDVLGKDSYLSVNYSNIDYSNLDNIGRSYPTTKSISGNLGYD